MLVTDAEKVAAYDPLAEWLIAKNTLPLVPQPVEGFLPRRMWMHKHQIFSLAHKLCMPSGDDWLRDDNVVLSIAPDSEHWFVEEMDPHITMDIAAHRQRGLTDVRSGSKNSAGCFATIELGNPGGVDTMRIDNISNGR